MLSLGGRLISNIDMTERGGEIVDTLRTISVELPGQVAYGGHLVNPGHAVLDPDQRISSIHRVWRDSANLDLFLVNTVQCNSAEERAAVQDCVTNMLGQLLRDVTPTSVVYSNEGDINELNWQEAFWGKEIYPKLLKIKSNYDREGLLWAKSTPGSEAWELKDETRLCKAR